MSASSVPVTVDFELLAQKTNSQVLITATDLNRPNPSEQLISVRGFLTQDIRVGLRAHYNSPLESQAQQQLSDQVQALGAAARGNLGWLAQYVPNFTLRTVNQSVATYSKTDKPSFTVHMILPCISSDYFVSQKVADLYDLVMPVSTDTSLTGATDFFLPPLGYAPNGTEGAVGVASIQLGNWFKAINMVFTEVDFSFSKAIASNGDPLYAVGTVTFEPYRMLDADELRDIIGAGS